MARGKHKFWKTETITAFAAMFVSLCSLIVFIYQAQIMQSQQHASVWPYVEFLPSQNPSIGFALVITNKGIGPALVKEENILLDGKKYDGFTEFMKDALGENVNDWGYSTVKGRVLAPGESLFRFQVNDQLLAAKLDSVLAQRDFSYSLCYCSIYDDCWTSYGISVKEGKCN